MKEANHVMIRFAAHDWTGDRITPITHQRFLRLFIDYSPCNDFWDYASITHKRFLRLRINYSQTISEITHRLLTNDFWDYSPITHKRFLRLLTDYSQTISRRDLHLHARTIPRVKFLLKFQFLLLLKNIWAFCFLRYCEARILYY